MLSHHCRRSKIAIVRDINQHVSAVIRQLSRDVRIRRLDADESSRTIIPERHHRVLVAGSEVAHESGYQRRSRYPLWERNIFAKRQQPNLIILSDQSTVF